MILLLGDIHGDYNILREAINKAEWAEATAIIQVGDFCLFRGYGMENEEQFREVTKNIKVPVYFIDGNHDDCSRWKDYETVTKVWEESELFYIPRGTVMELDGRTLAFMGGASSIDKNTRLKNNMHWDINETINDLEVSRLITNSKNNTIDIFVTHCPPHTVIQQHFNPNWKLPFGVGIDWIDENQLIIEDLWHRLGTPMVYSGHMHRRIIGENYRILDVNELLAI